jgi:hypothetical protein
MVQGYTARPNSPVSCKRETMSGREKPGPYISSVCRNARYRVNEYASHSFSEVQYGPVAQLEERIHGMDEVRSSSLLRSTIYPLIRE